MKNLFLTCALVFGTATLFAGVNTNETLNEEVRACVPATLSCGISGVACGDTTGDIIDIIMLADEILC